MNLQVQYFNGDRFVPVMAEIVRHPVRPAVAVFLGRTGYWVARNLISGQSCNHALKRNAIHEAQRRNIGKAQS